MNGTPLIRLNSGHHIPQLGLGVWQASAEQTEKVVTHAIAEAGYRHIDTAAAYGNEAAVGKGLRASGVKRKDIFVTTKLWNSSHGRKRARHAVEESLAALELDYIDLYLVHWPLHNDKRLVKTWETLIEIAESGKVRSIGVSNFNKHHLDLLATHTNVVPAVNQIELHPHFPQTKLRRVCTERGIAVESWSPLGGSGAGWGPLTRPNSLLTNPVIAGIGEQYGKSAAQVLIRWQLQQGLIVIPKSVHRKRVAANADVWDFDLSERDMKRISRLETGLRVGADPDDLDLGSPKD